MNNQLATKQQTGFTVAPQNMTEAMDFAAMISRSQMCPNNYMGKPEDTLIAMMMGNEVGLNPLAAIQNIAVINGRPSIYGDALMALVQNHPAFVSIEESFDENTFTAICTVQRKGGTKHVQRFSRQDAEQAKLWGKAGPWTNYPKRMLAMRARGFALRNQFADALAGLITREEAEDMPTEREVNPNQASEQTQKPATKGIGKPVFTQEKLNESANKWATALDAGKSADDLVSKIRSKYELSDELETQIKNLNQEKAA
jgi:hypothetical protein